MNDAGRPGGRKAAAGWRGIAAIAALCAAAAPLRADDVALDLPPPPPVLAPPAELLPLPDFALPPPPLAGAPIFHVMEQPSLPPPLPFRPPADAGVIAALSPPGAPPPFLFEAPGPAVASLDPPAPDAAPARQAEAPAPAAPQLPAPTLTVAAPTPEALRAALAGLAGAPAAQRREREALRAFYEARGFAPLWVAGGDFTPAARSALARLARAADDGLDLAAWPLPSPTGHGADGPALAELRLSEAIVAYGRQASGGRIDPQRVSSLITAKPEVAAPEAILAAVAQADDAGEALLAFNPPHAGYRALRAKLIELRQERRTAPEAAAPIPVGPTLRVGMRDPRVPLIRSRFGLEAAPTDPQGELIYDTRIASAIADFQKANGLPASGHLTPRTIAALSGGEPSRLENELLANMERWRWLPRDLGAQRIEVNIPDFSLKVSDGDDIVHRARVVVGKPDTPTPVFSDVMQFLIVNPYWNVPPSIIKKEMAPRLAEDPDYYTKRGYEVTRKGSQIIVRQPPGERNALGRIKFMFPNQHAVYLHDTPSRALFAHERRAYSHGCVRVDQPLKLAEVVLGRDAGWSEERVRRMIGGAERTVHLPRRLPVHLQYFTAFVDDAGRLQLRDDIYGFSRRLKLVMGLER
ncbi:MAG: L,D-transpeptidase family protein [Methylobacteriaceae bacterium]|nr:L,D-transpeptidase family protein [Methylobacteriaceae bacterium]